MPNGDCQGRRDVGPSGRSKSGDPASLCRTLTRQDRRFLQHIENGLRAIHPIAPALPDLSDDTRRLQPANGPLGSRERHLEPAGQAPHRPEGILGKEVQRPFRKAGQTAGQPLLPLGEQVVDTLNPVHRIFGLENDPSEEIG